MIQSSNNLGLHIAISQAYPFVKWAGGKNQLLSRLDSFIPKRFNQYFEPFLGGGAMFFHLVSKRNLKFNAYLSDTNSELINAYKIIKNDVERLIEVLQYYQKRYKHNRKYYYELREVKPLNIIEKAARFITLNKTCYNGLYRVNKNGIFNVPIGRYKNPVICDVTNLHSVNKVLWQIRTRIEVSSFIEALSDTREDDFIYLDPPYDPVSKTANFTSYTNNRFTFKDQKDLAKLFKKLIQRKCKVLLSNSDTPDVRKLYSDFSHLTEVIQTNRSINSIGSKRIGHKELLIRNYDSKD